MKGFRTILVMLASAVALRLFAKYGISISEEDQLYLVDGGMALVAIVMRFFTTTPVFSQFRAWLASTQNAADVHTIQRISPEVVDVLSKAVVAALAQHIKRPLDTQENPK